VPGRLRAGGRRRPQRNATNTRVPVNACPTVQIKVAEASALIDNAEVIMRRACEHAMQVARSGGEAAHDDNVRYRPTPSSRPGSASRRSTS